MSKITWRYSAEFGGYNPICEDVGEIEKFKEEGSASQGEGVCFDMKANGGCEYYGGGLKNNVEARVGFTNFSVYRQKNGKKPKYIFTEPQFTDGQIVDCNESKYSGLEPITCDPRVLYLSLINCWLQQHDKPEIKKFKIPTMEEARQWCNEVGIPERPIPFDRVNFNSPANARLRRNFPWWFDRD